MVEQNYFTESLFKFQVKWTKAIFEKEQKWSATATNKGSGKPNNNSEAAECTVLGFWDHLCPWKLLVIYRILRSLTNNPKSREKEIKWLFFIFSFFWVRKKWMKQKVKKKKRGMSLTEKKSPGIQTESGNTGKPPVWGGYYTPRLGRCAFNKMSELKTWIFQGNTRG